MSNLTKEQKDELVTSYAALALYDGDSEITSEQLKELIAATGNEVEPYWPMLFGKFLNGKIEELITSVGGGGGGGAAPAGGAAAPAEEEKKDDKKKKKEEKEEEADLGGGMDMFGGGGDGY